MHELILTTAHRILISREGETQEFVTLPTGTPATLIEDKPHIWRKANPS